MSSITPDTLVHIFRFMDVKDTIENASCVNKQWNLAANRYSLWNGRLKMLMGNEGLSPETEKAFQERYATLFLRILRRSTAAAVAHQHTTSSSIAALAMHKDCIYALCTDRVIYVFNRQLEVVKKMKTQHDTEGVATCAFALCVDDTHIASLGECGTLELRGRESGKIVWKKYVTSFARSRRCLAIDAEWVYVSCKSYGQRSQLEGYHKDGKLYKLLYHGNTVLDQEEVVCCAVNTTHAFVGDSRRIIAIPKADPRKFIDTGAFKDGTIVAIAVGGQHLFTLTNLAVHVFSIVPEGVGPKLWTYSCPNTDSIGGDLRHLCMVNRSKVTLIKQKDKEQRPVLSFYEQDPLIGLKFFGHHSFVTATASTLKVWDFAASLDAVKRQRRTWFLEDCAFVANAPASEYSTVLERSGRIRKHFEALDLEERNAVFGALYDIVKPEKHWEKWGEDAFYGRNDASTTMDKIAQAILRALK